VQIVEAKHEYFMSTLVNLFQLTVQSLFLTICCVPLVDLSPTCLNRALNVSK
jgi:hypothetical protein